ncbi:MAG: GNAT family N-acetyltransferase [Clostridia bacterium]|nr:GNAT family N-acetyltransferase [Clostridia bacterium]
MITFRNYIGDRTESGDYRKLHDFFAELHRYDYTYGRFDWMMTNWDYLEADKLNLMGIWEDDCRIVAVDTYDHDIDIITPLYKEDYEFLLDEMIDYALKNMRREHRDEFIIYASDSDEALKRALHRKGFTASEDKDMCAEFDLTEEIPEIKLPEGYRITSLDENEDLRQYVLCMFKGFDHEANGELFEWNDEREKLFHEAYDNREYLNKSLKVSVMDKDGNYVATCGMWYDKSSDMALIEPVCVVPECRRCGLGKAVVYEGLRRVKAMGAKIAVVGSSQQFYYSLGMMPHGTGTLWKLRVQKN